MIHSCSAVPGGRQEAQRETDSDPRGKATRCVQNTVGVERTTVCCFVRHQYMGRCFRCFTYTARSALNPPTSLVVKYSCCYSKSDAVLLSIALLRGAEQSTLW